MIGQRQSILGYTSRRDFVAIYLSQRTTQHVADSFITLVKLAHNNESHIYFSRFAQ